MIRSARTATTGLLAAALLASGVAVAAGPATAATTATASPTLTAPRARSLAIAASNGVVTMPTRLLAGTYYIHVATTTGASLQVVRPPSTLTPSRFVARLDAWAAAVLGGLSTTTITARYSAFRRSVTWVGGTNAVARTTTSALPQFDNGRGTFAITLSPGRYWFYDGPDGVPLRASAIRQVTVVGSPSAVAVPTVATARLTIQTGGVPAVSGLPAALPSRGMIRILGVSGVLAGLRVDRLAPGVTAAQLNDGVTCRRPGDPPNPACYVSTPNAWMSGLVSGGAGTYWYYHLPPGTYSVTPSHYDAFGEYYMNGRSPSVVVTIG